MGHERCAAAQQVAPSHPSGAIAVALRRRPTGLQILKTDGGHHRGRQDEEKQSQNAVCDDCLAHLSTTMAKLRPEWDAALAERITTLGKMGH
jgi:hypothetical protein